MTNPWDAEIQFSMDLAEELIAGQFPELLPLKVEFYGQGWDNVAVLVNGEWVFRFPQREIARATMEGELACLTWMPNCLPLKVPRPEFVGWPTANYPYVYSGYRKLPGKTACSEPLTPARRKACAPLLASFLRALHNPDMADEARGRLHTDKIQRADMGRFLRPMETRLRGLSNLPEGVEPRALLALAQELACTGPWDEPGRVVHGDLYVRHLLLNEAHQLCGVIDWGDAHLGDPALDLSVLYTFVPGKARSLFEAVYGEIDRPTRKRAKFRAVHYGVTLTHYGQESGDEAILRAGHDALSLLFEKDE